MKRYYLLSLLALAAVALLVLAGCSASAAAPSEPTVAPRAGVPAAPTTAPAAAQTTAPATVPAATSAPAASGSAVTLQVAQNEKLGTFLADGAGRTLYLFTKDTKNTSNCYDKCAQAWPPLVSSDAPALKDGIDQSLLGKTTRKDGSTQITYNGWPLYYFAPDKNPGDTNGQAVGKVWWVVSPEGNIVKPSGVTIAQNAKLGQFVADENGRSLYMYTQDSKNTSNCYGKCEAAWPPLLTTGQPVLGDGIDKSLLGTTRRKDGSTQVTYNGMPLYYWFKDAAPGDVTGQGVGGVWFVVGPNGSIMK